MKLIFGAAAFLAVAAAQGCPGKCCHKVDTTNAQTFCVDVSDADVEDGFCDSCHADYECVSLDDSDGPGTFTCCEHGAASLTSFDDITFVGQTQQCATEPTSYELTSGTCAVQIDSADACKKAGISLGLTIHPKYDANLNKWKDTSSTRDPPFCYYEDNIVKFNSGGKNTGSCGSNGDQCICGIATPTPAPTQEPTQQPTVPEPTPAAEYKFSSGTRCAVQIDSADACKKAGISLGLTIHPRYDAYNLNKWKDTSVRSDPPFCYYENNKVKFNSGGKNTGSCGFNGDQCICKKEEKTDVDVRSMFNFFG